MTNLTLTSGDTAPDLTGNLNANLTGATVVAHIRRPDRTVFTKAVTVTDGPTGAWLIVWEAGDLAQVGLHYVELEVTYSNGTSQTFALNKGSRAYFSVRAELA